MIKFVSSAIFLISLLKRDLVKDCLILYWLFYGTSLQI